MFVKHRQLRVWVSMKRRSTHTHTHSKDRFIVVRPPPPGSLTNVLFCSSCSLSMCQNADKSKCIITTLKYMYMSSKNLHFFSFKK